jgi:hypothetical protein
MLVLMAWIPVLLATAFHIVSETRRLWLGRLRVRLAGYTLEGDALVISMNGARERRVSLPPFTGWRLVREGPCQLIELVSAPLASGRSTRNVRVAPADLEGFARSLRARLPQVERRWTYGLVSAVGFLGCVGLMLSVPALPLFDGRATVAPLTILVAVLAVAVGAAPLVVWLFVVDPWFHAREYRPPDSARQTVEGRKG